MKPQRVISWAIVTLMTGAITTACQSLSLDGTASNNFLTINRSHTNAFKGNSAGLKLGAILPTTGELFVTGGAMLKVLPLITDKVNACGGVNGEPVTLVVEDDQNDSKQGTNAITKLIEVDNVNAVVGAFTDRVSMAALAIAVQHKVPLISPGSTSPLFTEKAKTGELQGFWARTVSSNTYQAAALAKLAYSRGIRTASTLVSDTEAGISFETTFVATFEKLGGKVLNKDSPTRYTPKPTSPAPDATASPEADAALLDIEAAAFSPNGEKPNAVLVDLDPTISSHLLKSAYEQGLTQGVQLLLTDRAEVENFPQAVGKRPDGSYILSMAIGTVPGASGPALADLTKLWQEQEEETPGAFVPQTWDAAAIVMLAAQAAGSNDGQAIKNKIREVANAPGEPVTDVCEGLKLLKDGKEINYQGASSNVDIDKNGDVAGVYTVWTVAENGDIRLANQLKPNLVASP